MSDLISRLSEIRSNYNCFDETEEPYYRALSEAIQLASAQLERTGKWIKEKNRGQLYQCSACGNYLDFRGVNAGRGSENYCPNCGAKMEENKID